MNKLTLILLVIWEILAVLNIISIFTDNMFFTIANYAFAVFNVVIMLGSIPILINKK